MELKQVPFVNNDLVNDRTPYTGFGFAVYVISCDGIKNVVLRDAVFIIAQAFYNRNTIPYNTGVLSQYRYNNFVEYGV